MVWKSYVSDLAKEISLPASQRPLGCTLSAITNWSQLPSRHLPCLEGVESRRMKRPELLISAKERLLQRLKYLPLINNSLLLLEQNLRPLS